MTHSFVVTLTSDDLVTSYRLHAPLRCIRMIVLAILALLAALVAVLLLSPEARLSATTKPLLLLLEGAVGALALVAWIAAMLIPVIWKRTARNALAQRADLSGPITYRFDVRGVAIETARSKADYAWSDLSSWREGRGLILLYLANDLFHPVPLEQVDPAVADRLRQALTGSNLTRR